MPSLRASALVLALALFAAPAAASEAPPSRVAAAEELEELAREAAEQLMLSLGVLLQTIPQYEMPEVLPNGDIIIRRKLPPAPEIPDELKPAPPGQQIET